MISCKDCATPNSLDSAFCKKCGKPLAQEEAIDARETVEKQLDHGFELFHHGRTDEAWLNVESCLLADPENLRALSLKGLILERRGLIYEALECYEAIVAKNPKAALERMKMQTLRGMLDSRRYQPDQSKRLALGIAVCVALLIVSIAGAIAVSRRDQTPTVATNQPQTTPSYSVDSSFGQGDRETNAKKAATEANQNQDDQQDPSGADTQPDTSQPDQQPARLKINPSPLNGALPDPSQTNSAGQDFKPVNPLDHAQIQPLQTQTDPGASTNNGNVGAGSNSNQSDPDPSTVNPADSKPSGPPPVVDIKLSDDQPPKESDLAIDANGIEAMVRTARGQYQVGNYQAAAATYERALSAGADPALTNQRLAQCYERLGRTSEAKSAYGKAIAAIQNQINGGRGNKDRLMAALNSSQQALKNLQGG